MPASGTIQRYTRRSTKLQREVGPQDDAPAHAMVPLVNTSGLVRTCGGSATESDFPQPKVISRLTEPKAQRGGIRHASRTHRAIVGRMSKPKELPRTARWLFWWLVPPIVLCGMSTSGWRIGIALYAALVVGVLLYLSSRPLTPEEDAMEDAMGEAYTAAFKAIGRLLVGLVLALATLFFVIWVIKRMWEAA